MSPPVTPRRRRRRIIRGKGAFCVCRVWISISIEDRMTEDMFLSSEGMSITHAHTHTQKYSLMTSPFWRSYLASSTSEDGVLPGVRCQLKKPAWLILTMLLLEAGGPLKFVKCVFNPFRDSVSYSGELIMLLEYRVHERVKLVSLWAANVCEHSEFWVCHC